ncbi:MAG: hypothetical protein ACJ8FY_11235 [Gemmataceae bacterium]
MSLVAGDVPPKDPAVLAAAEKELRFTEMTKCNGGKSSAPAIVSVTALRDALEANEPVPWMKPDELDLESFVRSAPTLKIWMTPRSKAAKAPTGTEAVQAESKAAKAPIAETKRSPKVEKAAAEASK